MADYRIELDAYAGPLDLLLHLVKRHEIDLHDIPMAELTADYLTHLKVIQEVRPTLDFEAVAEFLLMAATLVEVKSQMLVPRPDATPGDAEAVDQAGDAEAADPRFELVQQLLAYKRYKDAAGALEARQATWSQRFPATAGGGDMAEEGASEAGGEAKPLELEDVDLLDLCRAFAALMDSLGPSGVKRRGEHAVTYDDTPISLHAADIEDRLRRAAERAERGGDRDGDGDGDRQPGLTLRSLLEGRATRAEMIGVFLATLELVRQRRVRIVSGDRGASAAGSTPHTPPDEIRLELRPEEEHLAADEDAPAPPVERLSEPDATEPVYDWPDERSRRRYERRQRVRASREAQGDFETLKQVERLDDEDEDEETSSESGNE